MHTIIRTLPVFNLRASHSVWQQCSNEFSNGGSAAYATSPFHKFAFTALNAPVTTPTRDLLMDIDDILADAAAPAAAGRAFAGKQATLDLQELTRAWIAERVAPDVLLWPEALMERVTERIRQQIELVEEQTGNMDPRANFSLIVIQTELERFKFLVRSFLRARLAKIDAYPLHHLTDPSATANLSPSEHAYLTNHHALLAAHYNASFLAQFPPALRRLDDTAGGISMVDAPDADTAVFVRALRDVGVVGGVGAGAEVDMRRGDVWVLRWSAVKRLVTLGDVELV